MSTPSPQVGVRVSGVGAEIPSKVVTTAEVEERVGLKRFGFEPGWLERVTGVRERRWAAPDVLPSHLAIAAARKALADADTEAGEIDTLVFSGITRDCLEPATANVVADALGAREARVFDLLNACNGLMDGLDVADSLIRTGKAQKVLVTTGERATWSIQWHPKTTEQAVQAVAGLVVGDGGGAIVVERCDDPARGLLQREYKSDPSQWRHATAGRFGPDDRACETCGSVLDSPFMCNGRDLFMAAAPLLIPVMYDVMKRTGWTYRDLDVVFCHQPSRKFVDNAVEHLGVASKGLPKLWSNVDRLGNISTASLPTAMSEAREAGALVPGSKVLLLAPSSGVSAAAVTMIW
jgi:3-oxoacyl-(acyl-carrier-protein) synthase III